MKNFKTFKYPYLLIEDLKGKCQPIYKEYPKNIPQLYLDGTSGGCPFVISRKPITTEIKNRPKKIKNNKPKYCEICLTKYENYPLHVKTKTHRNFAIDDFNYKNIDNFISDLKNINFSQPTVPLSPCLKLASIYSHSFETSSSLHSMLRMSKATSELIETSESFNEIVGDIFKTINK